MEIASNSVENEPRIKHGNKPRSTAYFQNASYEPPNLAWTIPKPSSRPRNSRVLDTGLSQKPVDGSRTSLKNAKGNGLGSDILFDVHEQTLEVRPRTTTLSTTVNRAYEESRYSIEESDVPIKEGHPPVTTVKVNPNFTEKYQAAIGELNRLALRERKKVNRVNPYFRQRFMIQRRGLFKFFLVSVCLGEK
jgi:hypothetical protein